MADQSITPRPITGHIVPQGSSELFNSLTEAQLAALEDVSMTCLNGLSSTYLRVRSFLDQPGRDPEHQQLLMERGGNIYHNFEIAVDVIHRKRIKEIVDYKPRVSEPVPPIIEAPHQGMLSRLFGR